MNFNRAVIKVGSALVAPDNNGCSGKYILAIARFITECQQAGKEIIIVSSGSVAAGRQLIKHGSPVPSIPTKQAMASVGQMKMMANWQCFFDVPCSQLLITHGDLKDRQRYINIKNTLRILLENGVIPIVNENDTVATDELKVGDNDNLAALVALVSDAEIHAMAGTTNNVIATGGMKTKIQAAEKAVENGIDTYILNGSRSEVFQQILKGENPGTHFSAKQAATKARKHWLKHTLKSSGKVHIDAGAVHAVLNEGASLLPAGVSQVDGDFVAGESVDIIDAHSKKPIAKGICQYSQRDLLRIMGCNSEQIITLLGCCPSKVIIHRDDMVVL
jgi:glutamate 5-kinase